MNLRTVRSLLSAGFVCAAVASNLSAASWNGIQPLKSRRDDVQKILGNPTAETAEGVLRFNVAGGSVTVSFASEKFIATKKLKPTLAGTVLEIVLQHEHSSETPDSMNLSDNQDFVREDLRSVSVFHNNKTGVVYTFIEGKLRTTRFSASEAELGKARR